MMNEERGLSRSGRNQKRDDKVDELTSPLVDTWRCWSTEDVGHLIALENKSAMEDYLKEMKQGTAMKQKAYGTLFSTDRTVGEFAVGGGGVTSL